MADRRKLRTERSAEWDEEDREAAIEVSIAFLRPLSTSEPLNDLLQRREGAFADCQTFGRISFSSSNGRKVRL
jgi:hypothetical protein